MPFPAGFAQAICGASQERDVTGLVRRIRNLAFGRLDSRFDQFRSGDQAGTGKAAPADRDAKRAEKFTPIDRGWFVHVFLLKLLYVWMAKRISPPIASFYHARSSRATWPCQIAASGGALQTYMALIDTGASHTSITHKVITDLSLAKNGSVP